MESYNAFQRRALAGRVTLTFTDELRQFAELHNLSPAERFMLSHIHYRGAVPRSIDDWWYIRESIKRGVGAALSKSVF